jgi:hypothetical protein
MVAARQHFAIVGDTYLDTGDGWPDGADAIVFARARRDHWRGFG